MRVLTIISKLEMGGIEKTLLSCMPFLIEKGVKMSILCSLGGELDHAFKALGVELIDFGDNKKPFKDARFLKTILSVREFDIVHSRYGHTSGLFAKVCHDFKIPLLVSIHNERAMFRNSWIGKFVLGSLRNTYLNYHKKLTLKYATKIIGHSQANLQYFTNELDNITFDSQFQVLYNGVDFSKFHNYPALSPNKQLELNNFIADANKVFIHIGSFKEQKNHHFLVDIFKKLDPVKNNYRLILLGIGSLMDTIKIYVEEQGLNENVLFLGMQTNIAPYLFRSDLFIFPSLYEGFGNVLIEAQYANIPVAASAIAPHYEALEKGYFQYQFSPTDIDTAVIKITNLLNVENLNEQKQKAKLFSESFSVQNMVNNLMTIYKSSINAK